MIAEQKTALILLLILCFALISISEIGTVKAESTVYIRADGTVEGTDKIQRNGNVYTFSDNINAEIIVEIDDVVINGVDYILQGNGDGVGIYVPNNGNLEIKNIKIYAFKFAIYFDYYSKNNNIISGNTLTNNTHYGIYVYSSNNSVFGNYIEQSGTGIQLVESYNNTIFQNKIVGNGEGIGFGSGGGHSTVYHNLIADNGYAFTFWASSHNTIYGNNLINNNNQVHAWVSSNNWNYESIGNYWSDYNGTDTNNDGIGDTPYVISTSPEDYGDADNYPQMEPLDLEVIPEFPSWTPIYIRSDGSVEGTDKIQRDGNVYTLTGDISGGIKVERNFTVIDGAGYTLQGNGDGRGVDVRWHGTVQNLQIIGFDYGISAVSDNTILGNYIADCGAGIWILGGA
ncbi:MAG: right-handed parallel beta-helix repeat-containing protein, partial [Candidatus Bathyarchaeota archaeon]